jgi:PAS domain S-box-containing protein
MAQTEAESDPKLRAPVATVRRYGFAVACVGVAIALGLAAPQYTQPQRQLLSIAIAVVTWYAGRGPAVLAVLLSTAGYDFFFIPPIYTFTLNSEDVVNLLIFAAWGALVASFISTRRRIEVDLRRSRDLIQLEARRRAQQGRLLDQTHDSIIFRQLDGQITYWNRGAQELYGWRAEEAIGKRSHDLLHTVFPVAIEKIDAELLRAGVWEGELQHTRSDGAKVIVASRWSLSRDEAEQPIIMETNNDITERNRREGEIRKLNQELARRAVDLDASNKELESFAYSVSHDLRAPLRHVVGFAELLQKRASEYLDDTSRRYVDTILTASKRMGNLIDDLLAFSRVGRTETKNNPVSLDQLFKEAIAELREETTGRDIAWKIGALPVCLGDRAMLKLVVVNLVSNAVKFTRTRPHAEIEIGSTNPTKDEVEVFVRDNGIGFDMEYVDKLFGVFQRLHRMEEFEGTGIGLATVHRIIYRHGGKVRAEGVVDRGATFYFSLPKARE